MESMMIASPQAGNAAMPYAADLAQLQQGMQGGGGFAAILDLMLGGTQDGELMQLFADLSQSKEKLSKEGGELAAQMMAGLFAPGDFFPVDMLPADPTAAAAEPLTAQPPALLQQTPAWLWQNEALSRQAAQNPETIQPLQAFLNPGQNETGVVKGSWGQTAELVSDESGQQGQMQFLNVISEVKEQLKQEAGTPDESSQKGKLDIEQLQQEVDSGKYRAAFEEIRVAAAAKTEAPPLAEQVKNGIVHNLRLGKNEFVVKLKPEGLGEITVKMVETSGKLALSIVASSPETARLLNTGIEGLRESLRPYHAEVSEVMEQQQYASQQGGYEQNFAGHQHQHHHDEVHFWNEPAEEPADQVEADETLLSELDTYI